MSEPTNPYEAPKSHIAVATGDGTLASPWIRLGAAFIDGLVLAPVNFLLAKFLGKSPEAVAEAIQKGEDPLSAASPGLVMTLVMNAIIIAAFLAINFVFLKKGQSIGKLALKLQIQNRDTGALLPVNDLIVRRILPYMGGAALLSAIHPLLGLLMLADVLCIFRPGRNTLHDDLANTKVVKLPG